MKRYLTTLLLLALAIGLGLWVWRDRDRVSEGERRSRDNNVFSAWRREDLSRIDIVHEGETIVFVRDAAKDGAWRMTSPRAERVDQGALERLTTTLEFATIVRKVGDGDNLGLEHPRASGTLTMGNIVFHFALGALSPRPEGSSYLKVEDGAPFVVSKELTETLLAPSDTYRDRAVIPYLSLEMARFEVIHADGGFVVQRHDERSFDVPALGVLASRGALDKVWSALAEMRAEAFLKDDDADRLTAHPQMTIRLSPKDPAKPSGELVVGETCPGHPEDVVVLRKTPTRVAACAPRGAIEALHDITPTMLVDRRPFAFHHDEVEELRLEGNGAKTIEIARRGDGFHEREPIDRELSPGEAEAASEMLLAIEHTEATDVRTGAGTPFVAVAKARVRSGEHDENIEVGAFGGETVIVRRLRDDARLALSPAAARRLIPRETTLKPLVLLGETRRVTRVGLRCGVNQDLVDAGQGLRLVDPPGFETDGSIVQLVDGLVRGKVLAWTADRDDGTFGLSSSDGGCRVVLSFADGNTPATIRFGNAGEGGVFGNVDGQREVFVAPLALETLAKRIYVNRAALRTTDAERMTVTVRGKPVVAEDEAKLREAAGSLYAERAVAVGTNDVGPVDIELSIFAADASAPKRVVCSASDGTWRRCSTPGVKAVFEVSAATMARFVVPVISDAAVDAR